MARPREFNDRQALSAAMNVFWKHGYNDTSMSELCAAMQLNPGSLYAAYGSKQQLYHTTIRHYLEKVTEEGMSRLKVAPSGVQGIRDYFNYIIDGILHGQRCQGCLGTNAFLEMSQKDDLVREFMTEHFGALETTFRNALEKDGVVEADSHARHLLCMAQGLNVLALTSTDRRQLDQIIDVAFLPIKSKMQA